MKCVICGKPIKGKRKGYFYEVHGGKCSVVRSIVCTSVDDSKYSVRETNDLEALEMALEYEKRSPQPRKGIIQGIERRMRKIKKEIIKMKKAKYSKLDSRGQLFVDCTECRRGYNGSKDCSAGWQTKKPNRGGCFCGELKDGLSLK